MAETGTEAVNEWGDKTVKKPYDYKAKPTRRLGRLFFEKQEHFSFLDWDYIAQCVHAKRACEKLAEYITDKVMSGEPLSDEVICYLVLGVDKDQLIEAVSKEREEAQKKMAEEDYEKLKEALYKGRTEQGDKKDG